MKIEENNRASPKSKDIGMNDSFEVKDDDRDEMMKIIAMHAQKAHGIKEVTPELNEKIKKAIKS
jgi:predicted small metal-binding protein